MSAVYAEADIVPDVFNCEKRQFIFVRRLFPSVLNMSRFSANRGNAEPMG